MKKESRNYRMYLEDMNLAMGRISEYINGLTFEQFILDYKTADAVIRNFEIIGEASRKIPETLKNQYPSVPWDEMYLLRNKVSHEYFGIDFQIIWDVAKNHLPENKKQMVDNEQLKQISRDAILSQQAAIEARKAIVARFHT